MYADGGDDEDGVEERVSNVTSADGMTIVMIMDDVYHRAALPGVLLAINGDILGP